MFIHEKQRESLDFQTLVNVTLKKKLDELGLTIISILIERKWCSSITLRACSLTFRLPNMARFLLFQYISIIKYTLGHTYMCIIVTEPDWPIGKWGIFPTEQSWCGLLILLYDLWIKYEHNAIILLVVINYGFTYYHNIMQSKNIEK